MDLIKDKGCIEIVADNRFIATQFIAGFEHLVGAEDTHWIIVQFRAILLVFGLLDGEFWIITTLNVGTVECLNRTTMLKPNYPWKQSIQSLYHRIHASLIGKCIE